MLGFNLNGEFWPAARNPAWDREYARFVKHWESFADDSLTEVATYDDRDL